MEFRNSSLHVQNSDHKMNYCISIYQKHALVFSLETRYEIQSYMQHRNLLNRIINPHQFGFQSQASGELNLFTLCSHPKEPVDLKCLHQIVTE